MLPCLPCMAEFDTATYTRRRAHDLSKVQRSDDRRTAAGIVAKPHRPSLYQLRVDRRSDAVTEPPQSSEGETVLASCGVSLSSCPVRRVVSLHDRTGGEWALRARLDRKLCPEKRMVRRVFRSPRLDVHVSPQASICQWFGR